MKLIGRKKRVLVLGGTILLLLMIVAVISWPFIKPIKVTWSSLPYEYTIYGTHVEINKYTGDETDVVIPAYICFRPVKALTGTYHREKDLFYQNNSIRSVYIPDTVTYMWEWCFAGCENLVEVRLSPNMTGISDMAFVQCESLEKIVIPEGIEYIGGSAFRGCSNLKEVALPQSLKAIGVTAFANCEKLEYVNIPAGVEEIAGDSFAGTAWEKTWKEEFVIAGKNILLEYKGEDEVIVIPEGIEYIGSDMFSENDDVKVLIMPESLRECNMHTVWYCERLEYVVVKNSDMVFPEGHIVAGNKDIILVGESGSTTEAYAKEMGYKFATSLPPEYADYQ